MEPAGEVDVQGEVAVETLATTPAPQAAAGVMLVRGLQRWFFHVLLDRKTCHFRCLSRMIGFALSILRYVRALRAAALCRVCC